jgi:hypothetical protein
MNEPIRGGYIMLHRQFQSHDFWKERRAFSRAEAWLDILMAARWQEEPGEVRIGNTLLLCGRGEVLYSMQTWASRWGWTVSKVKRFLYSLAANRKPDCKRTMIELSNELVTTRIKICNYDAYQTARTGIEPETDGKRTGIEPQSDTTEEEKNLRREENTSTPAPAGFPHDLFARFQKAHSDCRRVRDSEFHTALAAFPGADVAEAVAAFERQLAGAVKLPFPIREFEKYLRKSADQKDGSSDFGKKRGGGFDPSRMSDKDLLY